MPLKTTLYSLILCWTAHQSCALGPDEESVASCVGTIFEAIGFSSSCVADTLALCQARDSGRPSLIEELRSEVDRLKDRSDPPVRRPKNCADLLAGGDITSGVRRVYPFRCCREDSILVYCDQGTVDGGWTVFQRREDFPEREDFFRKWTEYKLGFGNLEREFWLGLDKVRALVGDTLMELRVDLEDHTGNKLWAKYEFFHVSDESDGYRLDMGKYTGNAGNGFDGRHVGHKFSTKDRDNDNTKEDCAKLYKGGWWYDHCHISNLNGLPYVGNHSSYADGINWHPYKGYHYSLRKAKMAVRPRVFP